ncbi:MAG: GMC family oxidoreductase [Acidimicrobiia bacterium]
MDTESDTTGFDHDVIVIGSGFGGGVTALRLTEKGYRVAVLEAGRRWTQDTLPETSWDVRKFLWAPRLGCHGIQRLDLLSDILVLSGAGVGGGSLVYANTLYRPLAPFYRDRQWAHITDWEAELAPFYDLAEAMLGVDETPLDTAADGVVRDVAAEMGVADTYHKTPVGVFFGGEPGETVADPYFGGEGPERTVCRQCGACMTGCRYGAKNTIDRNYLYLAENHGARVFAEHEVTDVEALPGGGYRVSTRRPGPGPARRRRVKTMTAEHVVFSASALGTQRLLHRLRDAGRLPALSERLGTLTRTNSESIQVAVAGGLDVDYSEGIAITSSFHPDADTHIEPVRYGKGSNAMGLLATVMVDGGGRIPRPLRFLLSALVHPLRFLRSLSVRRWSERTIIVLVMQALDNSIRVVRKKGRFGHRLVTEAGHGEANPRWIPVGNDATRRIAARIGGEPGSSINEVLLDRPLTAHFIGGCPIGTSPAEGVIDPYHRVFGHPGLHVCDGSAVSANLGVNPSLTITAMTERAMAMWPNKGEPDTRPALGLAYEPVAPVRPRAPVVPAGAPAALRHV